MADQITNLYKVNRSVMPVDERIEVKEEDWYQCKELLKHFDPDAYGKVPTKKLKTILNCLHLNPTDTDINEVLKSAVDPSNNGKFGVDELCSMMSSIRIKRDPPATLSEALSELDHDNTGKIKISDAEHAFRVMSEPLDQDEFIELVSIGDPENTGLLDIKLLTKTLMGM